MWPCHGSAGPSRAAVTGRSVVTPETPSSVAECTGRIICDTRGQTHFIRVLAVTHTMAEDIAVQIVDSISENREVEHTELGFKLQEYLDADALRHLEEQGSDSWTLTFDIPDGTVTVEGDGTVQVDTDEGGELDGGRTESAT